MENKKVTKRDYFNSLTSLIELGRTNGFEGFDFDGLKEFVINELELLDKKAAAAKLRSEKQKAEGDALRNVIKGVLNAETFMTIPEIVAAVDSEEMSAQKAIPRLTQLINLGEVEKNEITIPGKDGSKSRKLNGYRLVG